RRLSDTWETDRYDAPLGSGPLYSIFCMPMTSATTNPLMERPAAALRGWALWRLDVLPATFAIAFGITMTLCVRGYQFGGSNHNVYLVDALRQASGDTLLANDCFTTQTLQYHALFGWVTRFLFQQQIIEPVFLLGHLLCIGLLHL